ncbi:hypothetical protein EYF80_053979 [Liparis tanakae]|uniref:Uncharacterized protein n=1 Tax=Liparis tanakae TaxID=230148 RepID=A0A4Z2F3Y6_9TELE|nr:hypothetical protein EYF80_053979 [Liparis tanakae]
MWVPLGSRPASPVLKSSLPQGVLGAVLAVLAVLAALISGLDRVAVGLRVGPEPQPAQSSQDIFLTVHRLLHPSIHSYSQTSGKASHYLGV